MSAAAGSRVHLRLYIAGNVDRSRRAIANLRQLCATHLAGNADVDIVDIYQQPELAEQDQVVAAPMLVRLSPLPLRRVIGDLSDADVAARALDLPSAPDAD